MVFKQQRKMYPGMWRCHRDPNLCCIYRVPNRLREVNPEAYTPQLLLIGPLHYSLKTQALEALNLGQDITYKKSRGYLNMEEHKKIYLAAFANGNGVGGKNTIDGFRKMIKSEEDKIRENYSESTAWIESSEFVEMVLHDSVFIIEFILRFIERKAEKIGDPLMDELCIRETVVTDLLLLENQLPFFILEKLFDPILPTITSLQTFRDLIIMYFGFEGKIERNSEFEHFTDLLRRVRVETLPKNEEKRRGPLFHIHNAHKLGRGGVRFKAVGDESSLCVSFENGCLNMPRLTVGDSLEMKLRNIMALEQCHYPWETYVCDYIVFLDYLTDTAKDVDLLVEKGIIQNYLGQPTSVAQMVNKLGLGIITSGSYYSDIAVLVDKYYRNPVNRSHAVLKRAYFNNLWTGTATMAAAILLVMTLIQTWASVTYVNQNES